jgi:hypothetical protein
MEFEELVEGERRVEIRRDDRNYQVGHFLRLREWNPDTRRFTGRMIGVEVLRISCPDQFPVGFGMPKDTHMVIMEVHHQGWRPR